MTDSLAVEANSKKILLQRCFKDVYLGTLYVTGLNKCDKITFRKCFRELTESMLGYYQHRGCIVSKFNGEGAKHSRDIAFGALPNSLKLLEIDLINTKELNLSFGAACVKFLRYLLFKNTSKSCFRLSISGFLLHDIKYIYLPPNTYLNLNYPFNACGMNYNGVTFLCDDSCHLVNIEATQHKIQLCKSFGEAYRIILADIEAERKVMEAYIPKAKLLNLADEWIHPSYISRVYEIKELTKEITEQKPIPYTWIPIFAEYFGEMLISSSAEDKPLKSYPYVIDPLDTLKYFENNTSITITIGYAYSDNDITHKIVNVQTDNVNKAYLFPYQTPFLSQATGAFLLHKGDKIYFAGHHIYLINQGKPIPWDVSGELLPELVVGNIALGIEQLRECTYKVYMFNLKGAKLIECTLNTTCRDPSSSTLDSTKYWFSYMVFNHYIIDTDNSYLLTIDGDYTLEDWVRLKPDKYRNIKDRLSKSTRTLEELS